MSWKIDFIMKVNHPSHVSAVFRIVISCSVVIRVITSPSLLSLLGSTSTDFAVMFLGGLCICYGSCQCGIYLLCCNQFGCSAVANGSLGGLKLLSLLQLLFGTTTLTIIADGLLCLTVAAFQETSIIILLRSHIVVTTTPVRENLGGLFAVDPDMAKILALH
jgi:hypothetical protein